MWNVDNIEGLDFSFYIYLIVGGAVRNQFSFV